MFGLFSLLHSFFRTFSLVFSAGNIAPHSAKIHFVLDFQFSLPTFLTSNNPSAPHVMTWILIAYLISLIFIATKLDDSDKRSAFRTAWISFAIIPLWQFLMYLFRAGNIRDERTLQLIDLWDLAIPCLLLGISFLHLLGALAPAEPKNNRPPLKTRCLQNKI